MRTIIDLPQEQLDRLAEICRREGISRAEAIRRAVAQFARERGATWEGEAFGLWSRRIKDGLKYQERLRNEWERKGR